MFASRISLKAAVLRLGAVGAAIILVNGWWMVRNVPAQRLEPDQLQRLLASYSDEAAQMVVDIMQTANYVTIDRPQWGAFVNQLDAGIIRDELSANEALTNLTQRLEELGAQV